ncbi:hypothetical protein SAMN05660653_02443 [Desulfonatronum thiosulfatophilum]|uniref:Uncharacterized protein n=1 Tax=Desulfonatronum thiosulfatophilum TaxID=617002 RepID=A0A1G6DXA4_9BACT|nr:hypothetical protein [Desulfonatronum thiosulfatophilum]SDB49784.1 hypothetical protein SAMN05660653_02443 [Desulfonatronum thiosulfatophilum]
MQKIPLNLAREGMTLAKPILRDNGLVLVAENTELTGSLLERLERMEIAMVTVQGNPVDLGSGGGENPYSIRAGRLDRLFRKHADDPWMQKNKEHLKNYFLLKAASALAGGEKGGQVSPGEGV